MRLLGGLVVEGRPAREVGSRKARTLLAALAVARGAPVGGGRARRGAVGRRPAGQAERAGRGAGQPPARRRSAPIGSRGTTPATRSSPTGSTSRSSTRASPPPSGRWPTATRSSARLAATMALDLVRGPLRPRGDARRGSTARGRRSERTVAATRLLAAEAALVSGDPAGAAALAARGPRPRSLRRGGAALADAGARRARSAGVGAGRLRRGAGPPGRGPRRVAGGRDRGAALGDPPGGARAGAGGHARRRRPERWDPLVQRARAELAAVDFDAARRDAEEAVRRGAGAGALEVAGWVAYYDRDFPTRAALRRGGRSHGVATTSGARARSPCPDGPGTRAATCAGAERDLEAAVQSTVAGVRGTGEVWLGNLRMHQGRFDEAIDLSARGAVDAAALRHPFVIPHAMWARVYALGRARARRRDPRRAGVARHDPRRARAGRRPLPSGASTTSGDGSSAAIGRTDEAARAAPPRRRHAPAASPSRGTTRCSTWRSAAVEAEDAATARGVARPGGGAARRRRRHGVAPAPPPAPPRGAGGADRGRSGEAAARLAAWVRDDAARRGARRPARQAEVVRAPGGGRRPARPTTRRSTPPSLASTSSPASRPGASPPAWPPPPAATDLWADRRALRRAARRRLRPRRRPRPRLDPERAHPPEVPTSVQIRRMRTSCTDVVRSWR